jgi:PPOX class probable F420-dependent enzyme
VPCCFVLDRDTIYSAIDAKSKSTLELQRLENLRWQPAAAVLVDHYDDDWADLWRVRADGRGRVTDHGEEHKRAKSLLEGKYPQYRHVVLPGAVIAVTVERWNGWPVTSRQDPRQRVTKATARSPPRARHSRGSSRPQGSRRLPFRLYPTPGHVAQRLDSMTIQNKGR